MSAVPTLRFREFDGEWAKNNLSAFVKVRGGYAFKSSDFSDVGIPVVRISNLIAVTGFVDVSSAVKHPEIKNDKNYIIQKGDILIALSGATTGKSCVYEEDFASYLNQRVGKFELISNNADYSFLRKIVFSDKFKGQLDNVLVAGAQPNIAPKDIEKFSFTFPSLPEQQKIASFLSFVDKKIDLLRQKKDSLELYKKGLMQKIFSQEIRFKQEDGSDFPDWEEVALGDVASVTKGKQLNRDTLTLGAAYPVINGGVTPSGYHDEFNTEENSITISEGGNSCGYVDFQRQKFWCGGHCYVLEPTGEVIDKKFAFQLLKYRQEDIMRLRVGSGLPNIQKGDLLKLAMVIPPELDEQRKIASFLSAIDTKIQKTSAQIEQIETFKKGLLQQMFV